MISLQDALTDLADRLHVDADELIAYADEDAQGGRGVGFNAYALDRDEGRLLYALIRALKPETVLEIGVYEGASTCHLLAAVEANGSGEVVSYDTYPEAGGGVPDSLTERWTLVNEDATTALLPIVGFCYEDGDHSLDGASAVYRKLEAMAPRVVVVHDFNMTPAHGDFFVKPAFESIFPDGFSITLEGCERGLGVWINEKWVNPELIKTHYPTSKPEEVVKAPTPAKKPATRRRKPAPKR